MLDGASRLRRAGAQMQDVLAIGRRRRCGVIDGSTAMGTKNNSVERSPTQQQAAGKPFPQKNAGGKKPRTLQQLLHPLVGNSHRRASVDIHQYLRNSILANAFAPNTILSQVEVAACLKVSRTPVREAFRMLQEEGLISAEPNHRCRVLAFDPEELELLYASRIMNEGISAAITVENISDANLEKLSVFFDDMRKDEDRQDLDQWILDHRAFHQMLFSGANPRLQQRMYVDCQRSERYVYNSIQSGLVDIFQRAAVEHREILRACQKRQSVLAASLLTRHLSRAGIDILEALAPHWDPITLRTAAGFMLSGATHFDDRRDR
jgi:DNA-binding GntR family transcriptional regulator